MNRDAVVFEGGLLRVLYDRKAPLVAACPMAMERTTKAIGKHWTCPPSDAEATVAWADQHGKSVAPAVREYASALWAQELDAMATATAVTLPVTEHAQVEQMTTTPLDTQQVVIKAATKAWVMLPEAKNTHRALIVADEPGLGKTLVALAAVRLAGMRCQRTVIICPTSLTQNWHAEMAEHFEFTAFMPWTARSTTPEPIPAEVDTVVIGWEILTHWVDTLVSWAPDAVIADEGHYAKAGKQKMKTKTVPATDEQGQPVRDERGNMQMVKVKEAVTGSARATAVLSLGTAVAKAGGLAMILTGTPVVNRPVEMEPLLDFAGILVLFGGPTSFKTRFCGPKLISIGGGRKTTEYKGASNLLELNARLSASGHYVRRTKQVLIEQGVMQRKYVDGVYAYDYTTRPNPWVIEATAQEMVEYRAAEEDLEDFFAQRARELAAEMGVGANTQKVAKKVVAEGYRHLQRIATLRQIAAAAKASYIIAKVNEMVNRGEKVVIAAHHRDIVNLYAQAYTGLKIQGEMTVQDIEHAKAVFNTTPVGEHPVLVLSVEAGKTGHTLCKQTLHGAGPACAYMVFAEQVWTPGDESQAQDRIWRIGQDRQVRIINALLAGSIDLSMYGQRLKKRQVVNAAVDAINPDEAKGEREGAGHLAWRFAQARLAVS